MAEQQDDCCLVCADPLDFTGFGQCGHKEVCSRCVARMRFVLKEKGCVFCRHECANVYFTRFMGDYTARLGTEDFDGLQARADRRELFVLPEINGYFDDERHFQEIRSLCGFTHPIMEGSGGKGAIHFNNFNTLKRHIETTFNQHFCDVCVKGRKVFVSEQLLYSKDTLRRHQDTGDEVGPMAESGFKGHPLCKFCRTRFYDSNELYRHMESSHENCFLCRRLAPDKYVYYRHYKELEDHFTKDHHPCPHPECLERKFVVYNTDYELKAHFAAEHGDQMKMSGAQRRQALSIPLQLNYRSRDDEETEPGPSARLERAAVVIGGGHNIGSRAARRGRGGGGGSSSGMHHSRSEPQIVQAMGQDASAEVSSLTFTAEDFPAPTSAVQGAAGPMGRWAAFAGSQVGVGGLSDQDFPSLPTLSKNQRRRIKEQQRTLAERLSSAAQPPRVLNRAAPVPYGGSTAAGVGPSTSGAAEPYGRAAPDVADFPALRASAPMPTAPSTSAPAPLPATSSASARVADLVAPAPANRRPPGFAQEEFPSLGGGPKSRPPTVPSSPAPPSAAYSGVTEGRESPAPALGLTQADVLSSLFMRPGSAAMTMALSASAAGSGPSAPPESTAELNAEDFPSLPPGTKPAGKARAGPAKGLQVKVILAKASPRKLAGPPAAAVQGAGQAPSTSSSGGVSGSLKGANKALVERVKRQLSGAAFDTFRQQSQSFMRGQLAADEYHDYMVSLGLLSLVAELVSLCPDASKRLLLLDVHRAFICSPAAQDPDLVGAGWMPPEVAVTKASRVAEHSAWGCPRCSLCNAPDDVRCEACGATRPSDVEQLAVAGLSVPTPLQPAYTSFLSKPAPAPTAASASGSGRAAGLPALAPPAAEDFPSLPSGLSRPRAPAPAAVSGAGMNDNAIADSGGGEDWGAAGSSTAGGKGKKSKGTTIKIGGLPTSGGGGSGGARSHPQNIWTQPGFKAKGGNQWSGQGGGKLAKMHGAVNDAWE